MATDEHPEIEHKLDARLRKGPGDWIPLEEFAPLPRCLEWRLSRAYWDQRGPLAFFNGDVPYAAINDGRLSTDAARLLTELCATRLPGPVRVLEVGGGSGIFAKLFLDELRILSPQLYENTKYVWTDASPTMLQKVETDAVFASHTGRVETQYLPVPGMAALGESAGDGFDLIIANYLLDNLPATLLRLVDGVVAELEVRASLRADLERTRLGGRTAAEWAHGLKPASAGVEEFVELYPWLSLECRHRKVTRADLKFSALIPDVTANQPVRWPHHELAWTWLKEALSCVKPGGGVLLNDYGHFPLQQPKPYDVLQHFGGSLANGVNFDELARWPLVDPAWEVSAPETDSRQLQSRWVARREDTLAAGIFRLIFDGRRRDEAVDLLGQAQERVEQGRLEEARWLFWRARERAPRCWYVFERWAAFCLSRLKDFASALELAEAGLQLHPRHPALWNLKGDALFEQKRLPEAEICYRRSLAINPREVRGRLNLAYVFLEEGRCAEALAVLAEALALDPQGDYRESLLEKQRQVLLRLSTDARDALAQQLNRFRNLDEPENLTGGAD